MNWCNGNNSGKNGWRYNKIAAEYKIHIALLLSLQSSSFVFVSWRRDPYQQMLRIMVNSIREPETVPIWTQWAKLIWIESICQTWSSVCTVHTISLRFISFPFHLPNWKCNSISLCSPVSNNDGCNVIRKAHVWPFKWMSKWRKRRRMKRRMLPEPVKASSFWWCSA